MKKLFLFAAVVVGGGIATEVIDFALGVSLYEYAIWQQLAHKVTYMIQGGAVVWVATQA